MRDMANHERAEWIAEFDTCCDDIKRITSDRNRGETNTLAPFYRKASDMWLLLDRCPEDLNLECRLIANFVVGDYLRDHRKTAA